MLKYEVLNMYRKYQVLAGMAQVCDPTQKSWKKYSHKWTSKICNLCRDYILEKRISY